MKKEYMLVASAATLLVMAACNQTDNEETSNDSVGDGEKVITDQLGREVTIPEKVDRVVNGGILPYYSTWFVATNSTEEIVGMHPNSYNAAENSILADMSPDVLEADTSFIQNGEVNVEELLKVNPQVYFENATDEKSIEKLAEAGIPTVALKTIDVAEAEPLATFNSWLELTGEITGITDRVEQFLDKGEEVQSELNERLDEVDQEDKPRILFLHQHTDKSIVVAGANFFGNQWIQATGGIDVAENDITGTNEVNMEQIYAWDPDMIYITNFTETQPEDLINNTVNGQDWSQVKAVQDENVHKVPLGIYRWFPPSGDAPLMLKWMAQNNHPDLFDYEMVEEIQSYYSEFYDYDVTEEQADQILHPSSDAAKQ